MWAALKSFTDDGDRRIVRPDHPVPPSATLPEIAAWMTYIHTKRERSFYVGEIHDEVDEFALRRYIAKTDYHLRDLGIWK